MRYKQLYPHPDYHPPSTLSCELLGVGVVVLHSKVGNVVIHGEAKRALGVNGVVVPLNINSGV